MTARLIALFVMLSCIVLRVVVAYDPFPGWMDDPTQLPWVSSTLGPTGSVAIDIVLMASAAIVAGCAMQPGGACVRSHARVWRWALTGVIGVILHAWWSDWDVDRVTIGLQWSASILAGAASFIASRDPKCRRLVAGVVLGCVGLVACRAGVQYFVENPQTYADFRANKASILNAHGWTEDSPLAKSFERRVSQPDAGGWFGLSNVLGTFAAGTLVATGALAVLTWRQGHARNVRPSWSFVLAATGTIVAGVTLALSMSKGAIVAAACGGAFVVFARVLSRHRVSERVGPWLGFACIVLPILAVVARGMLGDRLAELSLRFRWFYWQGSWNMIAGQRAWWGVGPGGFQDAYTRAKPAISPENVSNAHNVLVDAVSTLGLFGVFWAVLVCCASAWAGRAAVIAAGAQTRELEPMPRSEMRFLVGVGAFATLAGALVEREVATPLSTGVRLGGLFLFALIAMGIARAAKSNPRAATIAIAGGALTALIHAQIDMAGTSPGSAAWFFALLGAGAGGGSSIGKIDEESDAGRQAVEGSPTRLRHRIVGSVPIVSVMVIAGVLSPALVRLWRWERDITAAAEAVRPLAVARVLATNSALGSERQRLEEAAELLSTALGQRVDPTPRSIELAMATGRKVLGERAIGLMTEAQQLQPRHFGTSRAASELLLTGGVYAIASGKAESGRALIAQSRNVMELYVAMVPTKAGAWAWLGLVCRTSFEQTRDSAVGNRAIEAYEQAAAADPFGPINIPPLVDLLVKAGRKDSAVRWAQDGLVRHEMTRLDPLAGLSVGQLARLRELAGTP